MPPAAVRQGEGRSWSRGRTIESRAIPPLYRGRYTARFAETERDLERALVLRALRFRGAGAPGRTDRDRFDATCRHVLVEDRATGALVCTYRLQWFAESAQLSDSYTSLFYDLSRLGGIAGPVLEMGRFCIAPPAAAGPSAAERVRVRRGPAGRDHERRGPGGRSDAGPGYERRAHAASTAGPGQDADILRIAWGALTRAVDAGGVRLLMGCASFAGTDPARFREAFALLREGHLAPERWRPAVKAREVARFADWSTPQGWDRQRAALALPPLLRTYLAMGGRVSDHAVVDRDLQTMHVFTGLEIAAIPPARARALRLVAG